MASSRRRPGPHHAPPRARRTAPARRGAARAPARHEATAGFAIGTYSEDIIEANAEEHFGPRALDDRWEAIERGLVDRQGVITRNGWDRLNQDARKIERNSLAWLRQKFQNVRDEGHDSYGDLVGTLWFDPRDPAQAYLIDLAAEAGDHGRSERIDMVDRSYGDLADVAFDGVSDFGASVLGGAINFFNVEPADSWEEIEATLEREERGRRARRR